MRLDWILSPLAQYGILALGMMSSVALWASTSMRAHGERRRMAGAQESLSQSVTSLSAAVDQIRRDAREPEVPRPASPAGLNLTKRAQALRMHRRGESPSTIAAALESPRNEIELLLKVHGYLNS